MKSILQAQRLLSSNLNLNWSTLVADLSCRLNGPSSGRIRGLLVGCWWNPPPSRDVWFDFRYWFGRLDATVADRCVVKHDTLLMWLVRGIKVSWRAQGELSCQL